MNGSAGAWPDGKDPRVAGAWLWGSDGRGSADALSDIDLFVVFVDQCAHECLAEVEDWFTDYGTVLWSREVPYNAPAEGRYFTVGYPAPALPLAIDWYWQPASAAKVGTDTRVLFEKQPLPRVEKETFQLFPNIEKQVPHEPPEDPIARLEDQLRWFWFMYGPLSKWSARSQDDRIVEQLPKLERVVRKAAAFVQSEHTRNQDDRRTPLTQLRVLADEMSALHPTLNAAGVELSKPDHAYQCLLLAEQIHAEGWRPRPWSRVGGVRGDDVVQDLASAHRSFPP